MDIDLQDEIYKKGFNAGIEHSRMSPETEEKLSALFESLNKLHINFSEFRIETKTKLDYIQEQTTKTNGRVTGIETREKNYRDILLTWLIRIVFGAIGALALSVLEVTGVVNLFK